MNTSFFKLKTIINIMEFCECGAMILQKGKCNSCGKDNLNETKLDFKSEVKNEEKEFVVLDKENWSIHPIVEAECKKCNHKEARYYTKQTRAADEDETEFYKCENCNHKWRQY
jgi:DNA-directed RNA polymerase subunit M